MKRIIRATTKAGKRKVRRARVRVSVKGTAARPRLSVFRSSRQLVAQLINDDQGTTLAMAGSLGLKLAPIKDKKAKVAAAWQVGQLLAERALIKNIKAAVFDRGGYKYHGRVAAVAEGARAGGLKV